MGGPHPPLQQAPELARHRHDEYSCDHGESIVPRWPEGSERREERRGRCRWMRSVQHELEENREQNREHGGSNAWYGKHPHVEHRRRVCKAEQHHAREAAEQSANVRDDHVVDPCRSMFRLVRQHDRGGSEAREEQQLSAEQRDDARHRRNRRRDERGV